MDPYVTVEDAEDYLAAITYIDAWDAADAATQLRALLQASDQIDALPLAGMPYADWLVGQRNQQERAFPRIALDDPAEWPAPRRSASGTLWDQDADGDAVVPERVKRACVLQALMLLARPDRLARIQDQADGMTYQAAGGSTEMYDAAKAVRVVCAEAMLLLRPYLLKSGNII
jgi:hypothetical protein